MAVFEQRRAEPEFGIDTGPSRSVSMCRADDLKGFLQQLSDQIADADRRHSVVLRDMHERLSRLGGQTETLKSVLPKEFSADLERLEDGMAHLAQRIAESDHARPPCSAEPVARASQDPEPIVHQSEPAVAMPQAHADEHFDAEPAPAPCWSDPARAAFLTAPPALKSAMSAHAATSWSRSESAVSPPTVLPMEVRPREAQPVLEQPAAPAAAAMPQAGDEPWDSHSAEALTKLYDSVDTGLPKPAAVDPSPDKQPVFVFAQQLAPAVPVAPVPQIVDAAGPAREQIERDWLDARLNDIAARVEQSLADLRPEISLADLGSRFDQLEERWSSALSDVATRSDVEGLRLVEAHIAELTTRLEETQAQLARLDQIEAQLGELGHQLTDEQVVRLFGNLIPTEDDLTHFAEQAAEKTATRILAEMPAHSPGAAVDAPAQSALVSEHFELTQAAHADSTERLNALHTLLASFIDERRRGEAETAEALETMQHAMQHVLDRVDALDSAPTAPQQGEPSQYAHMNPPGPAAQARYPQMPDEAAAIAAEPRESFDDVRAAAKAAAAAVGRSKPGMPGSAPDRQQGGAANVRRIEPSLDHNGAGAKPHDEDEQVNNAAAQRGSARGASGTPGDRRSVIESARRSVEKAKSAGAPVEEAPKKLAAGLRDRLFGNAGDAAKGGIRPGFVLVPAVAMLLLASVWFIVSPKKGPVPVTAAIEEILPAAPAAKTGDKPAMTPSLAPSDNMEFAPAQPAQPAPPAIPEMKKPDERSDLLPMRGRRTTETVKDAVTETGSIASNAPAPGGNRVVAGPVAGMAIQQTGRPMTYEETMQVREKAQLASLSQRAAQYAAETSAVPPAAVPAALQESEVAAPSAVTASDGKTVVELPPAPLGPLSLRLAAAKGDPSAQFEIAARLAEGKGVKQDFTQAAIWYQRAAAQGLPNAQYRLAALYERGLGVKADPARARVWYKRAAEQGSVKAMHNLAVLSASRDQGSADYPSAVQWFGEAAERGLSDSQYNLGVLYESGLGVTKDPVAAYKWYSIAARTGDAEAVRRQQILRSKMDAITLQRAEESVAGWRPKSIEGLANDAVAAGTAWKSRAGN